RRRHQKDDPARRRRRRQEPDDARPAPAQGSARGPRRPRPDHPRLREEMTALATSLDGQWFVVRDGRDVRLFGTAGDVARPAGEVARFTLPADDAQLAFVGPPATLV